MEKIRFAYRRYKNLLAIAMVLVGAAVLTYFVLPAKAAAIDVVNGAPPVNGSLAGIQTTLNRLTSLPENQRKVEFDRLEPNLEINVVHFLRNMGTIPAGAKDIHVQFGFGSIKNVKAKSGDGGIKQGFIKDQLLARVTFDEPKTDFTVAVKCLNGMVDLPASAWNHLQDLGTREVHEVYTIAATEGMVNHIPLLTAIDFAEKNPSILLFTGKHYSPDKVISAARARQLANRTDRIQITGLVYTGDRLDLTTMTYIPASRH